MIALYLQLTECKMLGEGSHGTVCQAIHRETGRFVAIKIFNGRAGSESAAREFEVYDVLESSPELLLKALGLLPSGGAVVDGNAVGRHG